MHYRVIQTSYSVWAHFIRKKIIYDFIVHAWIVNWSKHRCTKSNLSSLCNILHEMAVNSVDVAFYSKQGESSCSCRWKMKTGKSFWNIYALLNFNEDIKSLGQADIANIKHLCFLILFFSCIYKWNWKHFKNHFL